MKINFILPGFSAVPIGGFKVVYQYANGLARRGHTVRVVHPPWCNIKEPVSAGNYIRQQVKIVAGPWAARRMKDARVEWFSLDDNVEQLTVPDVREKYIPDADATIASAWTTAPWVASYGLSKGKGFYLIQHYEAWDGLEDAVDCTWRLPLHKIVIAKWLREKADAFGELARTTYIPNGLDLERFKLKQPIEGRPPRIMMLGHKAEWKGTKDGLMAIETLHQSMPLVCVIVFGTDRRPDDLAGWIDYEQLPSAGRLTELYNGATIFLHPSWSEGLPAPPAEAMACGCAVVAAANEGVLDYITDGVTGLTAPIKSSQKLADCLLRLLLDDKLRIEVATAGYRKIQSYTWESAETALEELLMRETRTRRA